MLTKLFIFILVLSIIDLIQEIKEIVLCFTGDRKYSPGVIRRIFGWSAIAYIITIISTGF